MIEKLFNVIATPSALQNLMQMFCNEIEEKPEKYTELDLLQINSEYIKHPQNTEGKGHEGFRSVLAKFNKADSTALL